MITPSFSLTATERVLPRLALDWTTGLAQPGVDVARAGVATFVGANGLIQSASVNTQRIDWSTGTAGLLVEETKQNPISVSEDLTNAGYWGAAAYNVTVSGNDIASPTGDVNATKVTVNVSNNNRVTRNSTNAVTGNTTYTISFYALGGTLGQFKINVFDATNGVFIVNGLNYTSQVSTVRWQRVVITFTTALTTAAILIQPLRDVASTGTCWLWGFQLETGAKETSYIPNVGVTTNTRNADVATMTGTNFSDWYNPTEGSFFVQATVNNVGSTFPQYLILGDNTTGISFSNRTGNPDITFFGEIGNSTQWLLNRTLVSANNKNKLAGAYSENDIALAINGGAVTTDNLANIPTVTSLNIGANNFNGFFEKLFYYPQRLTNAELSAFTK